MNLHLLLIGTLSLIASAATPPRSHGATSTFNSFSKHFTVRPDQIAESQASLEACKSLLTDLAEELLSDPTVAGNPETLWCRVTHINKELSRYNLLATDYDDVLAVWWKAEFKADVVQKKVGLMRKVVTGGHMGTVMVCPRGTPSSSRGPSPSDTPTPSPTASPQRSPQKRTFTWGGASAGSGAPVAVNSANTATTANNTGYLTAGPQVATGEMSLRRSANRKLHFDDLDDAPSAQVESDDMSTFAGRLAETHKYNPEKPESADKPAENGPRSWSLRSGTSSSSIVQSGLLSGIGGPSVGGVSDSSEHGDEVMTVQVPIFKRPTKPAPRRTRNTSRSDDAPTVNVTSADYTPSELNPSQTSSQALAKPSLLELPIEMVDMILIRVPWWILPLCKWCAERYSVARLLTTPDIHRVTEWPALKASATYMPSVEVAVLVRSWLEEGQSSVLGQLLNLPALPTPTATAQLILVMIMMDERNAIVRFVKRALSEASRNNQKFFMAALLPFSSVDAEWVRTQVRLFDDHDVESFRIYCEHVKSALSNLKQYKTGYAVPTRQLKEAIDALSTMINLLAIGEK